MSRAELTAKFRGNAALAISDEQSARVIGIAEQLWQEPRVTGLMETLTA
jgi:hypothetical protein